VNEHKQLIDQLAGDLQPVKRLPPVSLMALAWLLFLAVTVVASINLTGPLRPGAYNDAVSVPLFSLELILGVLTISVAAWAALRSAIPGTPRRGAAYLAVALFVAWFTLYGVGFVSPALDTGMLGKRDHCVFESLILGIPAMGLGWSMLQRLYPLRPLQTAAALGLAAGLAPGLYMQLGCMYDPGHALAFHYAPGVAAAAIFAGLYSFVRGRASNRPM